MNEWLHTTILREVNTYRGLVSHQITILPLLDLMFVFPTITRGQFWPTGIVVACVCVCVCLSVCQSLACPRNISGPVQARITKFGPKMQKTLVKVSIVLWTARRWPSRSKSTSKSKFTPFELVRTITHQPFKLGSPNLDQRCKMSWLRSLLFWGGNWPGPSWSNIT